jgi:hypothetical protein
LSGTVSGGDVKRLRSKRLLLILSLGLVSVLGAGLVCWRLVLPWYRAVNLRSQGSYQEAVAVLENLESYPESRLFREQIDRSLAEADEMAREQKIYEQGVAKAEIGDWSEALLLWETLPEGSLYAQKVKSEKIIPHSKPTSELVYLVNYAHAHDPTWEELVEFLKTDSTDDLYYEEDSFICTGFAETLHNNAEKAGIRAAYVGVGFAEEGPGHAFNAFDTADRGLVYVDVTGPGFSQTREEFLEGSESRCEWDKIAFPAEGEKYGTISINYATLDPVGYQPYRDYSVQWSKVESMFAVLDGEIQNYNKRLEEHKTSAAVYEERRQCYEADLTSYNRRAEAIDGKIEAAFASERENLTADIANWKVRKEDYEKRLAEHSEKIELYNQEGVGDPVALSQESADLNAEGEILNEELELLRGRESNLNAEIMARVEEEQKELDRQKSGFDDERSELAELQEELNEEAQVLDELSQNLNGEFGVLKVREEELGICYWKPLGTVTWIEIYW